MLPCYEINSVCFSNLPTRMVRMIVHSYLPARKCTASPAFKPTLSSTSIGWQQQAMGRSSSCSNRCRRNDGDNWRSADPCWGGASEIPKGWFLFVFPSRRSRLQKLAICHPPTDPTTHTAFSASPTLPHSSPSSSLQCVCPNPLRPHRPHRPPSFVFAQTPSALPPSPPPPCAQTPSAPTALTAHTCVCLE